jgi:L-alanine-DL-glutamate epimerase-like enolase superfamily enzyme
MRIDRIRSRAVSVPLERPIVSAVRQAERVELVVVDVETDVGIVGQSYLQAFGPHRARAIQALIDDLAEVVVGEDPELTTRCWQRMWAAVNLLGRGGAATFALSGIDMALWDIVGKRHETPLNRLLGAAGDRVSAYQSAGLWLYADAEQLTGEAQVFLEQGFRAMKMRAGRPDARHDIEAARLVREALGPEVVLMIDANQAWAPNQAIWIGRALEGFGPFWLEEPVDHDDLAGHARVARELAVPIASGENTYLPHGFREMVVVEAADILMPDVQRVGGVTGWMRVAALAEAWRLPMSSHLFPEISVHLLTATPTAQFLEFMPWAQPLITEQLAVEDGTVSVPPRPGLGLAFDDRAIERFALA